MHFGWRLTHLHVHILQSQSVVTNVSVTIPSVDHIWLHL